MRKYLLIALVSFKDASRSYGAHLGSAVFLSFILFIYSSLWGVIAGEKKWLVSPLLLVWYLLLAEISILAPGRIPRQVEKDLAQGAVSPLFCRPTGYFRQRLAEHMGSTLFRAILLLFAGGVAALAITGSLPSSPLLLLAVMSLAVMGSMIAVVQSLTIGACAVWIGEATPLVWLWQKLGFVLGGMMIPLQFYPETLRQIALLTPFPATIYGPASLLFEPTVIRLAEVLCWQLLWLGLSSALLSFIASQAVSYAVRHGKG